MKVIRNNIFETNSSSTHSISIESVQFCDHPLTKSNILYPSRLGYYSICGDSDKFSILHCSTTETKLALVCQWIQYFKEDYPEYNELYNRGFETLKEEFLYDDIVFECSPEFYPDSEEYNFEFNHENDFPTDLKKFIDIIKDPDKIITDLNQEW